ncbi:unnamed protein product [Bemisia tabaci]|uniref:Protein tyrosine phosphatase type IVA 1 n=1 Tax=Bemisia tabaci TaxID=7038 RepID=A0A9P0A2S7_BEMTA|nr:PREDICTED: protein tyrosine phosphatase type IVA 1 [Bemisia tabaci]XP_018896055.1 PREDICTED: protein tyrosine phosphatase type IVA 1 [Bemisia tabaci]XP_018896056.1 PREDICTED: protein tyrosine phosphatase type IVA 1 [Bemisia tabaci]XP_018896057.1 PREDICTED: protein tyrosine phosphatase type IVA 1 [Bemisia tabaci]CAH0382859.1 unnamed protein product [Bemisia tabaci]
MKMTRIEDIRPGPCFIEYKGYKFLITDRPNDRNLPNYIAELKKRNVKNLVRVCEPTYKASDLNAEGINVYDLPYDDGTSPPSHVIDKWFETLKLANRDTCVAVHCVAGLGRAPVLVAIALIELGMKYEDAVELIRQNRRGAINSKQLQFLEKYRPKSRLKNGHKNSCCIQ